MNGFSCSCSRCLEGDGYSSLFTHLSITSVESTSFPFGTKDCDLRVMVDGWRLDVEGWKRF